MTDEPQRIGDTPPFQHLREVLQGRAQVVPADDELEREDPSGMGFDFDYEAERQRVLTEDRASAWRRVCPQRFHRAVLDDVEPAAREEIEGWLHMAPRPNLVLLGPVGVGKTYAALAAARFDWMERGLAARFYPVPLLLDLLRPSNEDEDAPSMTDLIEVPRLILDDIGTERPTEWSHERINVLIDARWFEERPMVATANQTPKDLLVTLGERAYTRLVGDDAVVVHLGGQNRRMHRAN